MLMFLKNHQWSLSPAGFNAIFVDMLSAFLPCIKMTVEKTHCNCMAIVEYSVHRHWEGEKERELNLCLESPFPAISD